MDEVSLEDSVARSLDAERSMLTFVPRLLKGLWALGGSPELIAEMIEPLKLPADKTEVLDLGCGKGAAAILLARTFGFRATGVDANSIMLAEAEKKATEYGVGESCTFKMADIREYVTHNRNYDLVIYASLGGVLGKLRDIIKHLRHCVRPGGYIVFDDGYLHTVSRLNRPGYTHYRNYDETIHQLTHLGDTLVSERILSAMENAAINDTYLRYIKANGKELVEEQPELREQVDRYIPYQEEECIFIDEHLTGAIWLLQKPRGSDNT